MATRDATYARLIQEKEEPTNWGGYYSIYSTEPVEQIGFIVPLLDPTRAKPIWLLVNTPPKEARSGLLSDLGCEASDGRSISRQWG